VSANVLAIGVANVLMLVLGAGLLPLLRVAVTPRELVSELPLAYAVGIAGTGILAAELALVHVPVGKVGLPLLAFGTLALGLWRLERNGPAPARRGVSLWTLPAAAALAAAAVYLANAARLFDVKPLVENDGWALWGLRAQALFEAGHPFAPVFTEAPYPALQYPLFLPELEAIDARFMSAFDGTAIHVQLLLLAVAFAAGAWTLLRPYAPSLLLALALLAVLTAPAFFGQLQTNSADVPLAMAIALGVAALAVWIRTGARGLLPTAALFLTAGAMTKNEGELFALTAFLAAFAATPRARLRPLLGAAGAWLALIVPWHLWLLSHDVTGTTWKLSHLVHPGYLADNAHRVGSAARQLLDQVWLASSWSRLPWLVVAGFGLALLLRRFRVASFGAAWLLLSFGGLLLVYWSSPLTLEHNLYNSADRTIDTLVITGVLLVPVLLAVEREEPAPREAAPAPTPATTAP
jgi:hypothetical protein